MTTWCEQRDCTHNASGRCALHSIKLSIPYRASHSTLVCETYDYDEPDDYQQMTNDGYEDLGW